MGNTLQKQGSSVPAEAAPAQGVSGTSHGLARAFLEVIDLAIYVGAFEVAGFDSEDKLQRLTHWDLDIIERQSHVPILPSHRERILEASRSYVGAPQTVGPSSDEPALPAETTSTDVTRNVSPIAFEGGHGLSTATGWFRRSKPASNKQALSKPSKSKTHSLLGLKSLISRHSADGSSQPKQEGSTLSQLPTQQSMGSVDVGGDAATEQQAVAAGASSNGSATAGGASTAGSNLKAWLLKPQKLSIKVPKQQPVPADFPSLLPEDSQQHAGAQSSFAAVASEVPASPAAAADVMHLQQSGPQPETATAAEADSLSHGFSLGRFRLSRKAKRKSTAEQQRSTVDVVPAAETATVDTEQPKAATVETAPAETASGALSDAAATAELDEDQHNSFWGATVAAQDEQQTQTASPTQAGEDAVGSTAAGEDAAGGLVESNTAENAEDAATGDAAAAAPGGLFRSLKRLRLKPLKPAGQTDRQSVHEAAAAITAAAATVAAAAAVVTSAAQDINTAAGGEGAAATAADGAPGLRIQIDPASAAGVTPRAGQSGEVPPPSPGPLTVNKTALNRSSLSAKLPPIGQQKRKAPTVWAELPGEVSKMAYAVTAPLAAEPLPPPKSPKEVLEELKPVGAWAGLPDKVETMSYAATAPISPKPLPPSTAPEQLLSGASTPAAGAWGELATEVSRMSYANIALAAAEEAGKLTPRHSQHGPRVSYSALQERFRSDPGYTPPLQPNLSHIMSARSDRGTPATPLTAVPSIRSYNSPAVTAGLPPSAQQLHEQVLARLRAHGSGHGGGAGGPNSNKQAVAQLVKELSVGGSGLRASSAPGTGRPGANAAGPLSGHAAATAGPAAYRLPPAGYSSNSGHQRAAGNAGANGDQFGKTWGSEASLSYQSPGVGLPAAPHRTPSAPGPGNALASQRSSAAVVGGTAAPPSSTAGSVMTQSSLSTRPNGCRAADVKSIVHRAKERVAARQRQQTGALSPLAQQSSTAASSAAPSPAPELSAAQLQTARSMLDQQSAFAAPAAQMLLPGQAGTLSTESSGAVPPAAGQANDGERAVRMLQDYRTISEVDKQIKARVDQLTGQSGNVTPTSVLTPAAVAAGGASAGPAPLQATTAIMSQSYGPIYTPAAAAGVQQSQQSGGPAFTAAVQQTAVYTQSEQGQVREVHMAQVTAVSNADGETVTTAGLFGISDALSNSYDAGKPHGVASGSATPGAGGSRAAAAPARSQSNRYDPNRNPFVSPGASPEPGTAGANSNVGPQQVQEDNPFLRESLVLQTATAAPAAAARLPPAPQRQQQQQWQGLTGWTADNRDTGSDVIGRHPGLPQAVVNDIAATWLAGRSAAPAAAAGSFRSGSGNAGRASDVAAAAARAGDSRSKAIAVRPPMQMVGPVVPSGAALASQHMASAAAAARTVDERIKRIMMTSQARTAAAAKTVAMAQQQLQQPHVDVLTGPAAADQGRDVQTYAQPVWAAGGMMHMAR